MNVVRNKNSGFACLEHQCANKEHSTLPHDSMIIGLIAPSTCLQHLICNIWLHYFTYLIKLAKVQKTWAESLGK